MRFSLIVLATLFVATLAATASADGVLNGSIQSGDPLGITIEGRRDFIEGWNVDLPLDGTWHYGAQCQGPTYVAGQSYYLERVEFMAGEIAGPASVEIREDDGSGCPTGAILASGEFQQVEAIGWQGVDLAPAVYVQAGQTYHINYRVVVESVSSFALYGDIIPHCWSWDCSLWEGPGMSFYWMAKFFGSHEPTAVDQSTWGKVKHMYR
ncbi:MAG: DUF4082 domain-containing protein [Candidatus Eisenbacteria bacterium]